VARCFQESQQSLARNRGRAGVAQGVKVQHLVRHHGGIEHDRHPQQRVVNDRKRGHRARLDAQKLAHQLGRAEGEAAGGAEHTMQRFELDRRILQRHDQEGRAFFVAQEQILRVRAGYLATQFPRFIDPEDWRMGHRLVRDAERVQVGKKLVRRERHRSRPEHDPEKWYPVFG
jgi:hypothetical protein